MEHFPTTIMQKLMAENYSIYQQDELDMCKALSVFCQYNAIEAFRTDGNCSLLSLFDDVVDEIGIEKVREINRLDIHIEVGRNATLTFEDYYLLCSMVNLLNAELDYIIALFLDAKIDSAFRVTVFTFE